MRLKITFDYQVLQRLCTELGGGVVSVSTAQAALQSAINNAKSTGQIAVKSTLLRNAFSNASLSMQGFTQTLSVDISEKFVTSCGQKQDAFPSWLQGILLSQAEECSSTGHRLSETAITVQNAPIFT